MIKTQKLIPNNYYKESRDFQLFGRLYDSIFNYLKTEIDLISKFPLHNNQDTSFIELLLKTLGFRYLREYQTDQLLKLASVWINIIKNKGSLTAIESAIRLVLRVQNIKNNYDIMLDTATKKFPTVIIKIRDLVSSQETSLLEEILNYILPVGVGFIIQNITLLNTFKPMSIEVEENTSLASVERKDISSLAKGQILQESPIQNAQAHTGTFVDSEKAEHDIRQGSIKVGTLMKKKEGN